MLYPKLGQLHFIWPKNTANNFQLATMTQPVKTHPNIHMNYTNPIFIPYILIDFYGISIFTYIYSPAQIPHQNLKSRHIHGVLSHFGHCLHTDSTEGSRGWSWFRQGISLPPKMMLPEMQYVCKIRYTSKFSGLLKQEVHPEYIWRYIPISTVARLVSFVSHLFVLWLPTFSWPWRSMPVRSVPRWHALGPLPPLHLSVLDP